MMMMNNCWTLFPSHLTRLFGGRGFLRSSNDEDTPGTGVAREAGEQTPEPPSCSTSQRHAARDTGGGKAAAALGPAAPAPSQTVGTVTVLTVDMLASRMVAMHCTSDEESGKLKEMICHST